MTKGETKLEKKVRFFWTYTIVLFSVAFVLILFSAFSATQFQENKEESQRVYQGAQKSLITITEENEALKAAEKNYQTQINDLSKKVSDLSAENLAKAEERTKYEVSIEAIVDAQNLYAQRNYKGAKLEIDKVDKSLLKDDTLQLYLGLKNEIDKKLR